MWAQTASAKSVVLLVNVEFFEGEGHGRTPWSGDGPALGVVTGRHVWGGARDWPSFEPWIAVLVETVLSPSAEALVATRIVRLSA